MKYIIDCESTGLDPISHGDVVGWGKEDTVQNKITCISILPFNSDSAESFFGENERELLAGFWAAVKDADELIGFNIQFDLKFLFVRSFINKISILKNFDKIKITDIMTTINPFDLHPKGRLRDYCNALGIEVKTENGDEMIRLYKERKFNDIVNHCEEDAKNTKTVWEICKKCNLL